MKKIIISLLILITSSGFLLLGQKSSYDIWLNSETDDFESIRQNTEAYFEGKYKGRGSGYKQWKRWEYLNERRLSPDGKVTNHTLLNWLAYQEYLDQNPQYKKPDPTDVANGFWQFLAPTSYINGNGWNPGIGRVNCIAFHPTDPYTFYIGTPSGGIWKTSEEGANWTSLCNGIPSIGVSGIVVNPANPDIIYILTGDGDGGNTFSIGVLKSIDGGISWSATGLTFDKEDKKVGYKLKMHPTNYNILFATTTDGTYKTTDAGVTWTEVHNWLFYDIEFKPGNPSIMYGSTGWGFFRSTDTGDTWTEVTAGVPTNAWRIEIGVSPNNPTSVYLVCGPAFGDYTFVGLYRSYDNGQSFSLISDSPNILGYETDGNDSLHQTMYDLAITVSRTDYSKIMVGGINTWVSDDYGSNWTITSHWYDDNNPIGYTHADIHALEINPLNNHLYCGSDGGIYKSTDFGNNWTDLTPGISNTQFYRIAGYEPDEYLIIGGTQDNGSNKWTGGTYFRHILGADGMDCMIDHTNPDIMYYCAQNGGLHKSYNGGINATNIIPDTAAIGSWITPIIMNPVDPLIIYGGYNDVYKSYDGGENWVNLGVDGREAMAIGTDNPDRVYASDGYDFNSSHDGGYTWFNYNDNGLPANRISFIAVNPNNSKDVFVTIGGFNDGKKVYRSTSNGESFTNITGSLPNVIVNCIAYENTGADPDGAVYIGTDVGVFYRNNSLGDWIPYSNWLPTVPVFDLEINEANDLITAGTFGRGLWRSPTYSPCYVSRTLGGTGLIGYSYYQAEDWINSTRIYNQGIGQEGYYKAGNTIRLQPGFHVTNGSKFKAFLGPCGAGIPTDPGTKNTESDKKNIE
ncbi:MAG: hypothetical protein H8D45_27075 [Bacteroidetes bacterium]|nr:hypothetical protein [Bacteroidota bacterium]MBL7102839.1 hypothetical protein [Bacteroidales bacterium]